MFEQELEMEEREASAIPLLLIVVLILAIVSLAGFYLWQSMQVLTPQEAAIGDQRCRSTESGHDSSSRRESNA